MSRFPISVSVAILVVCSSALLVLPAAPASVDSRMNASLPLGFVCPLGATAVGSALRWRAWWPWTLVSLVLSVFGLACWSLVCHRSAEER
jgi:hypothetical protein